MVKSGPDWFMRHEKLRITRTYWHRQPLGAAPLLTVCKRSFTSLVDQGCSFPGPVSRPKKATVYGNVTSPVSCISDRWTDSRSVSDHVSVWSPDILRIHCLTLWSKLSPTVLVVCDDVSSECFRGMAVGTGMVKRHNVLLPQQATPTPYLLLSLFAFRHSGSGTWQRLIILREVLRCTA